MRGLALTERTNVTGNGDSAEDFGANAWLVDEMYKQYLADKNSVDQAWWPTLEKYAAASEAKAARPAAPAAQTAAPAAPATPAASAPEPRTLAPTAAAPESAAAQPSSKTTNVAPRTAPIPADAPRASAVNVADAPDEDQVTPLRGMPKTLAKNMDESLTVPTATSVRTVPAKLLIDNRLVINSNLRRNRGGKVSFTHLIGWALIQALKEFPSQNVAYAEVDGKPSLVVPAHIGLGIAIDVPKADGTRSLLVPAIKRADTLDFNEFLAAYEDLVKRARDGKLTPSDF